MTSSFKQYLIVTGNYWAFTITDGALRMLVILYFYTLGYSAIEIAMLFLLYEFFGVVTNLLGGWLGARLGLNTTMNLGLLLQILALGMLTVGDSLLSVPYVMLAQALSGIAKDLNKMSAKSSVKFLIAGEHQQSRLYKWVAILTGSKNALKGLGFFVGAALLTSMSFQQAMMLMAFVLLGVLTSSLIFLRADLGKSRFKPKFKHLLSKSRSINILSAARFFLFGARDIWFVVALPVYFQATLNWNHAQVGTFMAAWIMGYGLVQSMAPLITGLKNNTVPDGKTAVTWAMPLMLIPGLIAASLYYYELTTSEVLLVVGLMLFGILFAVNSSVHSFLILAYAREDGVSLDVGFYYMANAMGRLVGTILSGVLYQWQGLEACLLVSSIFLLFTVIISFSLERHT